MAKLKNSVRVVLRDYGTSQKFALRFTNPEGRRRRLSVGSDYQYAQRMSMKFSEWLLEGKNPEHEIKKAIHKELIRNKSLMDFFPVFMERHGTLQSKRMVEFYYERFKNIARCPGLVKIPIFDISGKIMSDYMHMRKKQDGVSNATVNREATVVKTMLNKAVEWELIDKNPIEKSKLLSEAPKRNVYLTMEEATALLNELTESFANIVEYAIYTGFRLETILSLKIEQVTFHDIGNTGSIKSKVKSGEWNSYPVGPNAVEVLKRAIGNRKKGYVFINPQTGTRYNSVSQSFRRAVKKLNIRVGDTYLRFHDLKHVFATWLHERGVSLDTLRILCQHSKRSTTDRYTSANISGAANVLSLIPKIESPNSRKVRAI